jgi:site-specific DNA-methyltransferase (adenine-specific)
MRTALNQYFTPAWAAEKLVQRHFSYLAPGDVVLEPSCGDGRFLMSIPSGIDAFGIEIDPVMAEMARENSGRDIVVGDFNLVDIPRKPTAILGNPPYKSEVIDGFLDRCYDLLEYDAKIGFLLPVYYLQTASKVSDLSKRFSISQELLPRNLFSQLSCPIMWVNFVKAKKTALSGFFLYAELDSLSNMKKDIRTLFVGNQARAKCWKEAVQMALDACGGRATLSEIYAAIEGHKPTLNPWWREKVRQVAAKYFVRVGPGEYAIRN